MSQTPSPRIAIIGYGSQGRAHALNLRQSGFEVVVGLRPGGPTEGKARADGFDVLTPADAVAGAGLVAVLTPDMVQPQLYREVIEPNIKPGACLLFAHGFNVHYGQITPRVDEKTADRKEKKKKHKKPKKTAEPAAVETPACSWCTSPLPRIANAFL